VSNQLTDELKAQLFAQESDDPFLCLVTLTHSSFSTIRLVNNSVDILSNGFTFTAFPMKIRMPVDDGETARDFQIDFDNASLALITSLRSVTGDIAVKIDMILASMPDIIQLSFEDLIVRTITYTATKVSARIVMDSFLSVEITSERYTPSIYPGLF
jgi:hypothetical protein